MKTKITFLFLVAFLGIKTVFAADVLNQTYFGFESAALGSETAQNGWYIAPALSSVYMLSNEQAATGMYSLKFNVDDVSTITGSYAQCIGGPSNGPIDAQINMAAGQYVLTFKAYLTDNCPGAVQFWIQPGSATNNVIAFKLGGLGALEKNKWLTLTAVDNGTNTAPTTLATAIAGHKMQIAVPKTQILGTPASSSTLYIDDIQISTYVAPSAVNVVKESFECSAYANKTNKTLTVNAPSDSKIRLLNTLGAVISTQQNPTGKLVLSTSSYTSGIYFVEVSSKGDKVVKKISL